MLTDNVTATKSTFKNKACFKGMWMCKGTLKNLHVLEKVLTVTHIP